MIKKKTAVLLLVLCSIFVGVILLQTERLYLSHEEIVNDTIVELMARNQQLLPTQQADLAMLSQNPEITLTEITYWDAEQIELENTIPFFRAILDDDPIYRLQADLQVTFADGSQATLAWESWRYGLVIGPIVVSLGDGPPGFITAVAES
ncbi:MAG: hypothetical protein IT327_18235 [Anaerolineae bacterium]|nr:hypothetical protein [Anaerolineae bacterium]